MADNNNSDVFVSPVDETSTSQSHPPIFLVDCSASTVYNTFENEHIFDRITRIIGSLPYSEYRLIFWNSNRSENIYFANGVKVYPNNVKKNMLSITLKEIKSHITRTCLTFPHLGFVNIPKSWISQTEPTKIYFVTDGEIGFNMIRQDELADLKKSLSDAIRKLCTENPKVQLNIITVEAQNRDFTKMESLKNAAGSDVYIVIMDNGLTEYIASFVSYTPNNPNGFVQIQKTIAPKGFISYGDKYFSELKVGQFIRFLIDEVKSKNEDQDELLKIVQMLATTICGLTKDKPPSVKHDIINAFCNIFMNTSLDIMFVKFIIDEAVQRENTGTANVFAAYRAKLKDLYRQATELLLQNVKDSLNVNDKFFTLPIPMKGSKRLQIVTGHNKLVTNSTTIKYTSYPRSSVKIGDVVLPILPLNNLATTTPSTLMNEQCLRQWCRLLISNVYNVNIVDDSIIYIVLGIVLQIVVSEVSDAVKNGYRQLGLTMLKKKRLNSDVTELERLQQGEPPIPNSGKIESLYNYMNTVNTQLGLKLEPMVLWYAMCLALNDDKLIAGQHAHCVQYLKNLDQDQNQNVLNQVKDSLEAQGVLVIDEIDLPYEMALEYDCIITLEDVAQVGGYKFLPHISASGAHCSPVYILSHDGYNALIGSNNCVCPICYAGLTTDSFEPVGPKPAIDIEKVLSIDTIKLFNDHSVSTSSSSSWRNQTAASSSSSSSWSKPTAASSFAASSSAASSSSWSKPTTTYSSTSSVKPRPDSTLVILKGTVGSGKTTFTELLRKKCDELGIVLIVEGVDKYCKNGDSFQVAASKIKAALLAVNNLPAGTRVMIVIDTCGERWNKNTTSSFDADFTGWRTVTVWVNLERSRLVQYLSWSLRNVLRRTKVTDDCNYWLNPDGASVRTCIEVHTKKSQTLFGGKTKTGVSTYSTKEAAIAQLNQNADAYASYLMTDEALAKQNKLVQEILQVK